MAQLPRRKNCFCTKHEIHMNAHSWACQTQYLLEIERWLQDRVVLARVEYARLTSQAGEGMRL